jgi:hypothetical protein
MVLDFTAGAAGIAATALVFAVAAAVGAARIPELRVDADVPMAVTGSGFRPHESVKVSIAMGTRRLDAAAVASDDGGFTVRFGGTRLDRCATPLVISATGRETGRVVAKLPPRECAAP